MDDRQLYEITMMRERQERQRRLRVEEEHKRNKMEFDTSVASVMIVHKAQLKAKLFTFQELMEQYRERLADSTENDNEKGIMLWKFIISVFELSK